MNAFNLDQFCHEDDDPADRVINTADGFSKDEHLRVVGAISRRGNDWHQAFYDVRDRGTKKNNMSWSTFVFYARMRSNTVTPRDSDTEQDPSLITGDIADAVVDAMCPDADELSERALRVQEAIQRLPRAQFEAVVRWSVVRSTGSGDLTGAELRAFQRACNRLRDLLGDLATGTHVLRAPKPMPVDLHDLPEEWESSRQGVPCGWGCDCERHEKPATITILPGPVWTGEWIDSVPPVPSNWHTLDAGEPWQLAPPMFSGKKVGETDSGVQLYDRRPTKIRRRKRKGRWVVMLGGSIVNRYASQRKAEQFVERFPRSGYRVEVDVIERPGDMYSAHGAEVSRIARHHVESSDGFLRAA